MGKNQRVSQNSGGFCLNPRDSPGFFENCTRLLSCVFFNYFVGVKQGALGTARTGTGIFCPGFSGIPFSIQVVEQKEPPSTFQDIPSQTIFIPESALWKKSDQISRIFKHVD